MYIRRMQAVQLSKPGKDGFLMNNKHEALFCCGRRGRNYMILHATQFFYKLSISFLALKLADIDEEYKSIEHNQTQVIVHSVLLVLALAILFYIWFFILPDLLTTFTITTNVSNLSF